MNRRVEFMGAPINIPDVLSGIQTFVEYYVGNVIAAMAAQGGIVRPLSSYTNGTPPCNLYVSGGALRIRPGQLLFPNEPYPVVAVDDEVVYTPVSALVGSGEYSQFYVYATYAQTTSGIFKKRAAGFVYNDTLPGSYYNELLDDVVYTVMTSGINPDSQSILLGTLYNNMTQEQAEASGYTYSGGLTMNQIDGAQFTEHGIMAKFADRYLTLNSIVTDLAGNNASAGLRVFTGTGNSIDMFVTPSGTDYRWITDVPMRVGDPLTDDDVTTMKWVKQYVADTLFEVPDMLNFKMTNITPIGPGIGAVETGEDALQSFETPGFTPRRLRLHFKWGYDDILGTADVGTNFFTITNSGISFSTNVLDGYYFYIPQLANSYLIDNNAGNTLYLKKTDGTAFTFPGDIDITVPGTNNAWIHMNAQQYSLVATPVTNGIDPTPVEEQVHYSDSPTRLAGYLDLNAGVKYAIRLRGVRGGESGNWLTLPSGTFNKYYPKANEWLNNIAYSSPYTVRHPNIPFHSASTTPMVLNGTVNGFSVTTDTELWPDAEMYEIVYSTSATPSFTNPLHQKKVFSGHYTEVTVNAPGTYYVKLRPLIAGLQVCPDNLIQSGSVLAASVGSQYGELLTEFEVDLTTYYATALHATATQTWDLQSIVTPAVSGFTGVGGELELYRPLGNIQYPNLSGDIITISGINYVINQYDGDSIRLNREATNQWYLGFNGQFSPFYINVSERGRRLTLVSNYIKDVRIQYMEVNVELLPTYPVHIRVYQVGQAGNGYDNMDIVSPGAYQAVLDVEVLGANGNRSFIVDAYDAAYPGNTYQNSGGLKAHFKLYGVPLIGYDD